MIPTEVKQFAFQEAIRYPDQIVAEQCRRSLYVFMREFWEVVCNDAPRWNWHIEYLAEQLTKLAVRVAEGRPREHDLLINIPPGSTKSLTCSVMFPVWCWTRWPWMRFIVGSYSSQLSLEHAEYSRDIVRSDTFCRLFPHLEIKEDKDTKSNFRIVERCSDGSVQLGGNRYSTSVGGTVTGFHAHIIIIDDPINPRQAVSEAGLHNANHWIEQTLSTRKVDNLVTPTVLIMQRLHQDDPAGRMLVRGGRSVSHICLPGEIRSYSDRVRPVELLLKYQDDLLDASRVPWSVLRELELVLGQYGYAGQIGQNPTPPSGGMFKVDHFIVVDQQPALTDYLRVVRYWDKAGSYKAGSYTVGVKMSQLKNGQFIVLDVKRGQWATDERESIIRATATADGPDVVIYHEQEPGSGGLDSARATTRNLAGFVAYADRPTGDKVYRADPYSAQVNAGNVSLLRGDWVTPFIDEHRYFPFGSYRDQVDASSGAFGKLATRRVVRRIA